MGVAGIHRLFNRLEEIQKASVIIVIAGMEGALVSVVGGLVDVPVVPFRPALDTEATFKDQQP